MVASLAIITVSAQTVNLCNIEQGKLREVRIPLENLGAAGMLLEPRHWDWASKDPLPEVFYQQRIVKYLVVSRAKDFHLGCC